MMMSGVLTCQTVSNRLISVRMKAAPFNFTKIKAYAPTSEDDGNEAANSSSNSRMDGWMTCDFTSFSTVFQSYQDNGRMIMKDCVQWDPVYA